MVIQEVMQNFKIVALLLLGYFWLVIKMKKMKMMELLIIIATLATAEVSAGALAKDDQKVPISYTNFFTGLLLNVINI